MTNIPDLFNGLKISNYFKYLLYLCGLILIMSLFFEVKQIDVDYVRHISFWVIIISLAIWIFDDIIGKTNRFVYEHYIEQASHNRKNIYDYYKFARGLVIFSYVFQIIIWLIALVILL